MMLIQKMKTTNQTKRAIDGILLVNKPTGSSSNFVLQKVKRIVRAQKAGHTGSLDPLATGMLPICFGQATKFSQYLLDADKCYQVRARLGIKTDSSDSTGQVISVVDEVSVRMHQLEQVLNQFLGAQKQVPSMFSALKHQGVPLYKLARAGKEVERKARDIHIHKLELNEFDGLNIHLTVQCSKGTYIRNLVEDIGDQLEVGAHVTALHRVYTAGFESMKMYDISEIESMTHERLMEILLPVDHAIKQLPLIEIDPNDVLKLQQGQKIIKNCSQDTTLLRLYAQNDFMGIGELTDTGQIKANRLMAY